MTVFDDLNAKRAKQEAQAQAVMELGTKLAGAIADLLDGSAHVEMRTSGEPSATVRTFRIVPKAAATVAADES